MLGADYTALSRQSGARTAAELRLPLIEHEMLFLGVDRMRTVTPAVNANAYISLGEIGIKFDLIINNTALNFGQTLASQLALADSIAPYVASIEGPNEVDALPVTYDGLTGAQAADALQRDLYTDVHSDPALTGVAVLPFSLTSSASVSTYGDQSAYAGYGNLHAYGSFGVPSDWWMYYALADTTTPSRQTIITETGYSTYNGASGVNQDVQAKYLVNTLLEAFESGVAQTYLYQLMDPNSSSDPTDTNQEDHWGLFNSDGTPKLAATAIHNLTTLLADNSATASSFTPGSLNYSLSGLPSASFSELLQKSNGKFDLAVWQEPVLWNPTTQTEYTITPSTVTLSLAGVVYQVQVFDPLVGTAPIATYSYVNSVTLSLGSDALIVEITPSGTVSAAAVIPPAPAISGLSYGTDTGVSASDGVTANATPTLLGTAMAGVLVTLYDGATVLGTAVADSDGVWALALSTALTQGQHSLTAVASTAAGSSAASAVYAVTIDSVPPIVTTIAASLASGTTIHPGSTVSFTLTLSEPVVLNTSTGTPTLSLNTGGQAVFDAANSTSTHLVFDAVVLGGQSAANLKVIGLSLNGATVTDLAGNPLANPGLAAAVGSSSGIVVNPAALPVTLGTGPSSIVLGISEIGSNGDAQFTISVDGTQIGGIQTATAQHGVGSQLYTINGNFGQGSHQVAVTLLNGAWPYTRTLYVNSVAGTSTTTAETGSLIASNTSLSYSSPILWQPSSPVTIGSGPNSIVVNLSENAWMGDAQFTISVDGTQIGGTQTATAEHAAGQSQAFTLLGNFSAGPHVVTVTETNYAFGGSSLTERTLNLDSITAGSTTTILNSNATYAPTSAYATLPAAATITPVTLGTGAYTIKLGISEDAFEGNAQFTISVDGTQIGGTQTASAQHGAGQSQIYTINGNFGQGSHQVTVTLLNNAWDGTYTRKLYVNSIAGTSTTTAETGSLIASNTSLSYSSPILWQPSSPVTIGSGPNSIVVNLSENAWMGDAQFTISVDGTQIGGTQTATAEHAAGQSQAFTLLGNFSAGPHTVTVTETNYAFGGSSLTERTLNLDSVTAGGTTTILNSNATYAPTSAYVTLPAAIITPVTLGTGAYTIKLGISEDAFEGNAQFTISVDGAQIGGVQTATAAHGLGQSQIYTINGNFGQGSHQVAVTLLNGAWPYTRTLYVNSIAGTSTTTAETGSLIASNTSLSYSSPILWQPSSPVTIGSGPNSIVVNLSENAWMGDAQFTISVDGTQIGGTQTATAEHAAGQSQAFTLLGNFSAGPHVVTVTETNYAFGGSSLTERTLNLDSITAGSTTTILNSNATYAPTSAYATLPAAATITPVTLGTGAYTIKLGISEDAFEGNAQFTISVDGTQIGGVQTASAQHGAGQSQAFTLNGSFSSGAHTVTVTFLNDASGGSQSLDRNLYVDSVTDGGATTIVATKLETTGATTLTTSLPATPVTAGTIQPNTSPSLTFVSASGAVPMDTGEGTTPITLAGSSSRTAFILHAGAANGDIITNFKAGTTAGDFLELAGYGAGATMTQVNTTTWMASSASGAIQDTNFTLPTGRFWFRQTTCSFDASVWQRLRDSCRSARAGK